ncbi:MAG: site-2 protease family protein [Scytolyngbya sp. HA4215-MV1]|jgi:Zn-dependent protease|nr:site-2 protease family protein [Scytolyngbya sp. HA4215-MV1]
MQSGWRVGSLFGIPLFIDLSWVLILTLFMLHNGWVWRGRYPEWGVETAWLTGFLSTLLLFASVLLHELAHSLVAKAHGIEEIAISLFLFGGSTSAEEALKRPSQILQVAIAGPAVSLGLAAGLSLLTLVLPHTASPLKVLTANLATMNWVVALFNLIPGLPLDGGQILKAIIWQWTGDQLWAIRLSAKVGELLGGLAISFGIADILNLPGVPFSQFFDGWWMALLGWFGWQSARAYQPITELQEALLKTLAAAAMTGEFRIVPVEMSLANFAREYLTKLEPPMYLATQGDRYQGIVVPEGLNEIERSQWEHESIEGILHPDSARAATHTTANLAQVIQLMEAYQLIQIPVLSPAGALLGVIDRGDIVRILAHKLNIRISDSMIQQIKADGIYPPGFRLSAIAQTLET